MCGFIRQDVPSAYPAFCGKPMGIPAEHTVSPKVKKICIRREGFRRASKYVSVYTFRAHLQLYQMQPAITPPFFKEK
jgi:hypothetical protein